MGEAQALNQTSTVANERESTTKSERLPEPTPTVPKTVPGATEALVAVRNKWQETSIKLQTQINGLREARDSLGDKITDIDDALHILGYIDPKANGSGG